MLATRSNAWPIAVIAGATAIVLLAATPFPSAKASGAQLRPKYLSPIEMALSPDGHRLYVVCQESDEVRIVDTANNRVVDKIAVGRVPRGIAIPRDGHRLYVTNAWSDTVSVIDTKSLGVTETLPTGFEPTGIALDETHNALYVANRLSSDISVIDLKSGAETKRLLAGRGSSYLALSPDGKRIFGTHIYPNPGAFRTEPNSEITVIDTERQVVVDRKRLHNVAGVFHVAMTADGRLGVATQLRPKNLIPLAHVEHGWVFGDSFTLFGDDVG